VALIFTFFPLTSPPSLFLSLSPPLPLSPLTYVYRTIATKYWEEMTRRYNVKKEAALAAGTPLPEIKEKYPK
jgi:hypothetical protein